mgnify:CR=1 FL=1
MPMSVETRGSSAPTVSATHAPNDMPAAQSGAPGYCACMKSSAARKSSMLAGPVAELSRAGAGAAEVEAQHRAADPAERLRRLVDDLRVHRAAVLGLRVREDDRGAQAAPAMSGAHPAVAARSAARAGPRFARGSASSLVRAAVTAISRGAHRRLDAGG